jgi:hypothetical protein
MSGEDSRPSIENDLGKWLAPAATLIGIASSVLIPLPPTWRFIAVSAVLWALCYYLNRRRGEIVLVGSKSGPYIYPERVRFGAFIGLVSIPSIVLGTFVSPIILPRTGASTIGVTINKIEGNGSALIEAPYAVLVKGTASIADGSYVYLVVNDGNAEYVQPDLVQLANGNFEGYCFLGEEKDPNSINKMYSIYAIVTDTKYGANARLNHGTINAVSNAIDLYRTR